MCNVSSVSDFRGRRIYMGHLCFCVLCLCGTLVFLCPVSRVILSCDLDSEVIEHHLQNSTNPFTVNYQFCHVRNFTAVPCIYIDWLILVISDKSSVAHPSWVTLSLDSLFRERWLFKRIAYTVPSFNMIRCVPR